MSASTLTAPVKLLLAVSRVILKPGSAVKLLAPVTTKAFPSVIAPPAVTVRSPDTVTVDPEARLIAPAATTVRSFDTAAVARLIAALEFKTTSKPEVMVTAPV